jgi:hypothetical protein
MKKAKIPAKLGVVQYYLKKLQVAGSEGLSDYIIKKFPRTKYSRVQWTKEIVEELLEGEVWARKDGDKYLYFDLETEVKSLLQKKHRLTTTMIAEKLYLESSEWENIHEILVKSSWATPDKRVRTKNKFDVQFVFTEGDENYQRLLGTTLPYSDPD